MNKLLVITGQTATGKTKLAIQYSQKLEGELINCDSRQTYKYLDVITGKDKQDLGKTPIHLYGVVDPKEYFSSYDFKVRAVKIISDITRRNKTPIIVGGTYLYISHLLYGIETENIKPDLKLRKKLGEKSVAQLQEILSKLNFDEFNKLNQSDKNNAIRLIRRIEIITSPRHSGLALAHPKQSAGADSIGFFANAQHNLKLIGLRFKAKKQLVDAIRQRVVERLEQGAVGELKELLNKGYKLTDPGLKTKGCKELYAYITKEISKQELVEKWVKSEVNYAKRQYTFMKRDKKIKWIDV